MFLFFAVPIGGRVLSSVLGRKLGSVATGGAVGVLAWLFTSSLVIGGIAAVVGMVFALISGISGWAAWAVAVALQAGAALEALAVVDLAVAVGGGGGGGFSSGGGGNFGGGGASGNW